MIDLSEHVEFRSATTKTYLHCSIEYDHQIWQVGELPWEDLDNKVTWPPLGTKLCRIVTYLEQILPIKSQDP